MMSRLQIYLLLLSASSCCCLACTLCADGSAVTKPEQALDLTSPVRIESCGTLAMLLSVLPPGNSSSGGELSLDELCQEARSLATLCGCPVGENSCTVCGGAEMTKPLQVLDGLVDLGERFSFGLALTCELVESAMNAVSNDDPECIDLPTDDLRNYCGCPTGDEEVIVEDEACLLCPGGEIPVLSLAAGLVHGVSMPCQDIQIMASNTTRNSDQCKAIQDTSTRCGCPIPPDSCIICPTGTRLANSTGQIATTNGDSEYCQGLEARLHRIDADDEQCQAETYRSLCGGCVTDFRSCTVCSNRDPTPLPNKVIVGIDKLGFAFENLDHITCGVMDGTLNFLSEDSSECRIMRATMGNLCGCESPVGVDACTMCGPHSTMAKPHQEFYWTVGDIKNYDEVFQLEDVIDIDQARWSCDLAESFLSYSFSKDDFVCYHSHLLRGHGCGCSRDPQADALVWTQRTSGFLSLVGSLFVLVTIFQKKPERFTPYNQIIMCISIFDCLSSLGYIFGTALTPTDVGMYGSIGNEATCGFQAFLFQAGLASVYYSLALSIYFLLIVRYRWSVRQVKALQWWVHGSLCFVSLAMAGAVVPFASPNWRWCYVAVPPQNASWLPGIFFFIAPVALSLVALLTMTIMLVVFVRTTHQRTSTNRLNNANGRLSVSDRTLRQALLFLGAFFCVWPIQFAAFVTPLVPENYWVFFLAALLGPLQGFLNALVVFARDRRSIGRRLRKLMGVKSLNTDTSSGASGILSPYSSRSRFVSSTRFSRHLANAKSSRDWSSGRHDVSLEKARVSVDIGELALTPEENVQLDKMDTNIVDESVQVDTDPDMVLKCTESNSDDDEDSIDIGDGLLEHALDSGLLDDQDF